MAVAAAAAPLAAFIGLYATGLLNEPFPCITDLACQVRELTRSPEPAANLRILLATLDHDTDGRQTRLYIRPVTDNSAQIAAFTPKAVASVPPNSTSFAMILDDGGRGILERADVCIVGAGPVGIALALECERRGLSVTLLESGSDGFDADAQALSTMEIVDPRHHAPSDLAIRRALGGTSLIWCGRCVPYDDIDFERREHVAESGWPIEHHDIARYYAIATTARMRRQSLVRQSQLDCGKPVFRAPAEGGGGSSEGVRLDSLERWCRQINSRLAHSHRLTESANLRIHLKCTAVDFKFADDGQRLEGVVVASGDARRLVTAHHYVLAGGGIECARLLLHAQTIRAHRAETAVRGNSPTANRPGAPPISTASRQYPCRLVRHGSLGHVHRLAPIPSSNPMLCWMLG